MPVKHNFKVGDRYRNRNGEYEVLTIDGDTMTVRYDDGREQRLKVAMQATIWQSILDEKEVERVRLTKGDVMDDGQGTTPVRQLVAEVLQALFRHPYPGDITDQVCLAIESNPNWLSHYWSLVEHFSSTGKNGRLIVNTSIGWFTKDLTGMMTVEFPVKAKSSLIQEYSRLGYQEA
jgi:hypothetical protein